MEKKCRHCENIIDHLCYSARYSETTYGNSSGTCDLDFCNIECDSSEADGSDDFEEDDFTYTCPECGEEIYDEEDDLIDVDKKIIKETKSASFMKKKIANEISIKG